MKIDFLRKDKFCNVRPGETRFGEAVYWIDNEKSFEDFLTNSNIPFCLVGIPEDIGIRANFGRAGAWSAFEPSLQTLCNTQKNPYLAPSLCALGIQVHTLDLMNEAKMVTDVIQLRFLVEKLDERVEHLITLLFSHHKVPIIIGGGHNNALPVLRAFNNAFKQKISVMNIDAHTDLRHTNEGRHSGNSFSFALEQGLLEKYFVLGYHENYLPDYIFQFFLEKNDVLGGISFEELKIKNTLSINASIEKILTRFKSPCGLELDMDSIIHVPSSARTSSGLSPEEARQCVYRFSMICKPCYFHICEAAPVLAHRNADNRTGKLISFLITDFIKGYLD
jgi:formiminoglutamase